MNGCNLQLWQQQIHRRNLCHLSFCSHWGTAPRDVKHNFLGWVNRPFLPGARLKIVPFIKRMTISMKLMKIHWGKKIVCWIYFILFHQMLAWSKIIYTSALKKVCLDPQKSHTWNDAGNLIFWMVRLFRWLRKSFKRSFWKYIPPGAPPTGNE